MERGSASQGRVRRGPAAGAMRWSPSTSRRTVSSAATEVLGAKVKVPTPEGPVMLSVPKGTTSGRVLRLKGRGFTSKDGKRGDQLVTVEIDVPESDAELQKFAESWVGGGNPRASLGV